MVEGNIVGNVYDKYGTKNPIALRLMAGFLDSATGLFNRVAPSSVLEVGCGEGHLAQHLLDRAVRRPVRFEACDLELGQIAPGLDSMIVFKAASAYELPYADDEFELLVCCEVLEHLEHAARALGEFERVASKAVLLSTPREPLWRALNIARGKYLTALGNTPGHIQHFSRCTLSSLVAQRFHIAEVRTPIPWTMLLAEIRS
jgi:ubiquinone/menaquinone biosynthesis C-methylase UbiE